MVERRFFPWGEPLLPQVAASLAGEFAGQGVVDLGETLLVLPGSRAGRRLMELLWEAAVQRKARLVPPSAVVTSGALPEKLYEPRLPLASDTEVRLAWLKALEETPPGKLTELLGPATAAGGMAATLATARRLVALQHEVAGAGLGFREVAAVCRAASLFAEEDRWQGLAEIQERARALLTATGKMDRYEARKEALAKGGLGSGKILVLVGVVEVPPLVRRMLEAVQDRTLALVHAPPELAEGFDALGLLRKEEWMDRPLPGLDRWLEVVEGPAEGGEAVVRFLGALETPFAPEEVTVGVTHRDWLPFLTRSLGAHALVCRYAEGLPVSLSPPGQLLRAVRSCLSEGTFRALAALLRHPDLPPAWRPLQAPAEADRHFQAFLPWEVPPGVPVEREEVRWQGGREFEGELVPPLSSAASGEGGERPWGQVPPWSAEAGKVLSLLVGKAPLSRWMPRCLEAVNAVYGEWKIPAEDPYRSSVLEACLAIGEVARNLWSLPPELDRVCTGGEALAVLLEELEEVRLPPPPAENAVEGVGWLELHLDDAPVAVLLGANEPYLPGSVGADPFLPNALRTLLGLEDDGARLARDRYRLEALLRSVRHFRLVSFRKDALGESLLPSRLLLRVSPREAAETLLRFFREAGDRGEPLPGVWRRGPRPPAEGGFRLPPVRVIPVPELPRPLPVTALSRILEDPFLWALEQILGLEEISDRAQELDALLFGTLAHAVLERFARTPEASSWDPGRVAKALERSLEEVFRRRFPFLPLPAVEVQREQLRARLRRFAEWQARWVEEGWRIVAVELRTPPEGVPLVVDGEPVWLSARMDRLDWNATTGHWMILDYKTGEEPLRADTARDRHGRWRDLQLPLYRYLLRHMVSPSRLPGGLADPQAQVAVAYLNLSARPGPVEPSVGSWKEAELEEALETARQVVRDLRERREVAFELGSTWRRLEGGWARLLGVGAFSPDTPGGGD